MFKLYTRIKIVEINGTIRYIPQYKGLGKIYLNETQDLINLIMLIIFPPLLLTYLIWDNLDTPFYNYNSYKLGDAKKVIDDIWEKQKPPVKPIKKVSYIPYP
jgi:hypothetical protein